MYAISYLELNICCLIIMMLILHKQVRGLDKRLTSQTFTELIVSAMVYIFLDMIYGLQQNAVIHLPVTVSKIVNVMMFVSLYSLTHLVFAFMECELGRTWVEDSKKRQLSLIPALILTIMTICSLKWHFFFYVDAEGIFQRGAFYGVIIPFVYIYIFLVTLRIFTMFPQKKYYALRGKLEMIFGMVVFPVIAGILQMFFTEISIICFGLTLGIIQVFTAFLTNRITMDELTQINNRTKLMQYLEGYMERHTEGEETDLHFLMIDLDDFKRINDTYGHVEGDRALIRIARVLKKTLAGQAGILARYGGDEFCIAGEMLREEAEHLIKNLYENLEKANKQAACPYDIGMSVGCAQFTKEVRTIPDLVSSADEDMYLRKEQKRTNL